MSFFQVTSSELRSKAEELSGLNRRFSQELESLLQKQNAINGMWEGEAKETFYREFLKDKTKMDSFYNAVNQYVEALTIIASSYEEAENSNLSLAGTRTY